MSTQLGDSWAQVWAVLGQEKGPNNDQTSKTVAAQSPRLCQAVVSPIWAMVPLRHSLLDSGTTQCQAVGGGIAQCRRWYRPYPEILGDLNFGSIFEVIWGL